MKKIYTTIGMGLLALVGAGIFFVSCSTDKNHLTYRLKWVFNASVIGDIIALEHGYFEKESLAVNIKEGSPEKNAITEIELGQADFGVASADQVIRALDKGANIVVIAQLFQENPLQWIYRSNQFTISTLADLKGKKIGMTFGGNDEIIMNTLLAGAGIKMEEIQPVSAHFDFTPFLKKEVDLWPVYRNSQGVLLENRFQKEGEEIAFLNPSDFGVKFVANSVITSKKMAKENPDLVKLFLSALLNGWEAAMAEKNQITVISQLKKLDTGTTDKTLVKQLNATRQLVKPMKSKAIGVIDVQAWEQTEQILLKEKQIGAPVKIANQLILRP